jgi:hypothetical protein
MPADDPERKSEGLADNGSAALPLSQRRNAAMRLHRDEPNRARMKPLNE